MAWNIFFSSFAIKAENQAFSFSSFPDSEPHESWGWKMGWSCHKFSKVLSQQKSSLQQRIPRAPTESCLLIPGW
jgi:hypothetical protein